MQLHRPRQSVDAQIAAGAAAAAAAAPREVKSRMRLESLLYNEAAGKGYIAVPACRGSLAEAKRACNQTSPI
eukprot:1148991-Pelagomonas_calceolata.AAC.3